MSTLWGKSQAQRDADRQQVLFEREEIARRDQEVRDRRIAKMIHDQGGQRAMTAVELGQFYGNSLRPWTPTQQERLDAMDRETAGRRDYHFGTDIPAPTWREVEEARARSGEEDAGVSILGIMAIAAIVLALAFGILYLALT